MQKSIHRPHHKVVCAHLRQAREEANFTQADLAHRFGSTQAWVSSVEVGITRLDLVQVWEWCHACGIAFASFCSAVETELRALPTQTPKTKGKRSTRETGDGSN